MNKKNAKNDLAFSCFDVQYYCSFFLGKYFFSMTIHTSIQCIINNIHNKIIVLLKLYYNITKIISLLL